MKKINIIITILTALLFIGCASHAPKYREIESTNTTPSKNKEIDRTFYLIGNAGFSKEEHNQTLTAFKKYISSEKTKDSYTIFLGNSFYPGGLPDKNAEANAEAKKRLEPQLNALKDFKGKVVVLPGNLDWRSSVDGLENEEDLLEEKLNAEDILQPNNGCPLESVEVGDNIQLIIIDSQWYLENWNDHPKMNDKCEIKTRAKFFVEVEGELKKNKHKTIIFAMHHPLMTNGPYGGRYGAINQLLPVPGLASLIYQIRSQGAISKQDRYNESYHELMSRLNILAKDHERMVFVSGHEKILAISGR